MALELECLDLVPEQPGPARAARHLAGACIALRDVTRATDSIGWDGASTFRVLLVGADDGRCRYVRRVVAALQPWLDAQAAAVRLAIAWAGPTAGTDLRVALTRAESRLDEDRSRARLVAVPA